MKTTLTLLATAVITALALPVQAQTAATPAPNNAGSKNATTPNTSDREKGPEFTTQPRMGSTPSNPAPTGAANATTPGTQGRGLAGAQNTTQPTGVDRGVARDSATQPNPSGAATATTPGTLGRAGPQTSGSVPGEGNSDATATKKKAKKSGDSRNVSARFDAADLNGDGQLSRSEYEQMMSGRR
jgi:hypothetical protein